MQNDEDELHHPYSQVDAHYAVEREYTSQERAALVAFWIAQGETLDGPLVAMRTGLSNRAAWQLLCKLCRVLPIAENGGTFHLLTN